MSAQEEGAQEVQHERMALEEMVMVEVQQWKIALEVVVEEQQWKIALEVAVVEVEVQQRKMAL